jgi:hypothetical protein
MSTITGNNEMGSAPAVIPESFQVQTSGECPDGLGVNLLGVIVDDSQNNENGAFALGFEFDIPAGMSLDTPLGSNGQSFDVSVKDDPSQRSPQKVYWAIYYMPDDAKSPSWEIDFQLKTSQGSGTYTFTKKRFM